MREFRLDIEEREKGYLSQYAAFSSNSKGSINLREKDSVRTLYMQDRDRIIHSEYFRRLKDKAQVIMLSIGDFRTRLTHTLEVTQIARTIARALRLNEDLIEAIGLSHDLGHTPFGHAGEKSIRKYYKSFHHASHSLRVVEKLEKGRGLNLTFEVRDGIIKHTKGKEGKLIDKNANCTLEAQIVRIADSIAYINHDIDDAIKYDILKEENLPKDIIDVLGRRHSERINTMILSVIRASIDKDYIDMEKDILLATENLRMFMFKNVYESEVILKDVDKVDKIISSLFDYYLEHIEEIHKMKYFFKADDYKDNTELVKDYIAYLTDSEAIKLYEILIR